MADVAGKPTRPRARPKPGKGVAKGKKKQSWYPAFIGSLVAAGASIVVLVLVLVSRFGGDDPPPAVADATSTATADASPTRAPATPGPTPTPIPTVYAELLPCGDILVPIDKEHRLGADCAPGDLETLAADISAEGTQAMRREAATALRSLFEAAAKEGFRLYVNSSYRSYATQEQTFNQWVQTYGLPYAERTSARAGHSEHQLGTTADVGFPGHYLEDFGGTAEAGWLAANSWKFGFIVSYPDGKENITGYAYEPWHIRYLGLDVARKAHDSGITLREFLLRR